MKTTIEVDSLLKNKIIQATDGFSDLLDCMSDEEIDALEPEIMGMYEALKEICTVIECEDLR